jgi:hypothetical protein
MWVRNLADFARSFSHPIFWNTVLKHASTAEDFSFCMAFDYSVPWLQLIPRAKNPSYSIYGPKLYLVH